MTEPTSINTTALAIFVVFFALITVLGFVAARWKRGDLTQLHEYVTLLTHDYIAYCGQSIQLNDA